MDFNRFEADVWEERITKYLQLKNKVTVTEVARNALSLDTPSIGTAGAQAHTHPPQSAENA